MTKSRTLIVGDIHGCYEELLELLDKVSYEESLDRLIFVGDLINKGPQSLEVLRFARDNQVEVVLGNHELGFLSFLKNPDPSFHIFVKLVNELGSELEEWTKWISGLPFYIEEEFIVVHGGMIPGTPLEHADANILTRIRTWDGKGIDLNNKEDPPWYELYDGDKLVVYGHWASKGLTINEKTIGLDTGCCWGGKLSLLHLETKEIFQVDAKKAYA